MDKKLQIALCATHGAGKTSLVDGLVKEFNLTPVTETIQKYWEVNGIPDFTILTPEERAYHQKLLLVNQIRVEKENKDISFITDRSVVDYWGYTEEESNMPDEDKDLFGICIESWCANHYDFVIHIPLEERVKYVERKNRAKEATQKAVEDSIARAVKIWVPQQKLITVSGSIEERLEQAIHEIKTRRVA